MTTWSLTTSRRIEGSAAGLHGGPDHGRSASAATRSRMRWTVGCAEAGLRSISASAISVSWSSACWVHRMRTSGLQPLAQPGGDLGVVHHSPRCDVCEPSVHLAQLLEL